LSFMAAWIPKMRQKRPAFACLAIAMLWAGSCGRGGGTFTEPVTGLRFVRIERGEFVMGSPSSEVGRQGDEVPHRVTLMRSFYISATEVTQAQWQRVMGRNPSTFARLGGEAPVEQVSWNEVQEFLRRLNAKGNGKFRLPTEAEWEYACRADTETAYAFGDRLSTSQSNYDGRYPLAGQEKGVFRNAPSPVASYRPNRWGVFDAHGNVWEWCVDEYCAYPAGAVVDPVNACGSRFKVIRGGSWYFGADSARSAMRYTHEPHLKGFSIGFRVVREM
jgi:formylglycine-generating enzyme required for sulfatase activity